MPRTTDTRERLTLAALAFIDEHGVDALTLRALGATVGLHHTALYRHFASKDQVLTAVYDLIVGRCLQSLDPLPEDPRERLVALISGLRAALREHPAVTVAHLYPNPSLPDSTAVREYQRLTLDALSSLGLGGRDRLIHYQLIESFMAGASTFDFASAPTHLESRRERHRTVPDPAFEAATRTADGVDEINEAAFARGVEVIVAACVDAGAQQRA